ncbi:hypothetical protein BD779DRAFT_1678695 [Infundibulicybe gibba]|nr:hypothetical protein BD779DRAFT_1678695 [Infundibulicybe gibba]
MIRRPSIKPHLEVGKPTMNANTTTSDARDIRLANYLLSFALAFLYYDHLITIDREIKYVWGRPKMLSAYLFLANRYVPFLANLVVALFQVTNFDLQRFEVSLSAELVSQMAPSKLQELQPVTPASPYCKSILSACSNDLAGICSIRTLVSGLRKHGRSIPIWTALTSLPLWTVGVIRPTNRGSPAAVWLPLWPMNDCCSSIRLVVPWIAVFAYDSMIFAFTLAKTWQAGRKVRIHGRLPIIALLLRDGTIYFAVMALANLANILTFYFCGTFLRGGLSTFSNRFALYSIHTNSELNGVCSISVTMMSRLMLNLHETASVGIFSVHISTLGPMSRAENFDESLVLSELPHSPEHVGGAGPQEIARDRTEMPNLP